MRSICLLAASLALTIAPPALAGQKAAKIAVTPKSEGAAIVIRAPDLAPPPGYASAWRLGIQAYDAENRSMRGGPFGGGVTIASQPKLFAGGYLVADIRPGAYVIRDFSRQDFWALCFHADSVQFTIRPGEVLYLGSLDAAREIEELLRFAVTTGSMSTRGNPVHFFDGVAPPALTPGTEADLAAVAAMMKAQMPGTTVAPRLAAFSPARFGTGRDLFGLSRICGGYYAGKAKDAPPAAR